MAVEATVLLGLQLHDVQDVPVVNLPSHTRVHLLLQLGLFVGNRRRLLGRSITMLRGDKVNCATKRDITWYLLRQIVAASKAHSLHGAL